MVNSIISYIGATLKANLVFVDTVDAPVKRWQKDYLLYKGEGSEKQQVAICDQNGNGVYIRQIAPEQSKELKAISSCDKRYKMITKCRLVYYSFTDVSKEYSSDKIKSILNNALKNVNYNNYSGTATDITTTITAVSTDFEKIFYDELGKNIEGDTWPLIVAIDFSVNYTDINCEVCDFEMQDYTPVAGPKPDCQKKDFCEAVSECQSVIDLQEKTESLQEQIDNIGTGLTCDDLPNCQTIIDIQEEIDAIPKIIGTITVIENIAAFEVVNADGSLADSSIVNKRDKVIGIALQAIANGFSGDYQSDGPITNPLWNFVKGDVLFLNGNTISNIAPTSGFSQMIGKAINNNTINININQAIRL